MGEVTGTVCRHGVIKGSSALLSVNLFQEWLRNPRTVPLTKQIRVPHMPLHRPEEYDQLLTQFHQQTERNPKDLALVLTDILAPIADYFFRHTDDIREETVFLQALICGRGLRRIIQAFQSQHLDDTLEYRDSLRDDALNGFRMGLLHDPDN
jgi:hypothetical protein